MSVKIERIVLDSSMCEFERLQRFKEQIAVEFAEKDLTPYLSGEVSCTKKFPEPKLGYVLKWRQEEVTVSSLTEVAKNLFESPIKLSSPLVSDNTSSSPTLSTRKKALIDDLGDDIVIGAPDSEGVTLSPCPTVVVDEAVYYSRLESVKKESASQFKMRQYHSEKVTAGVSILKSRCTIGLHEALLEEFASRDIPAIIKAIEDLCGPGEVYSGLEKLEKSWWMLAKIPKETIAETCKRVEKLAKDIATYPGGKRYADMELLSAVDRILQVEANYESFWWQILDALRDRRASWTAIKHRLQNVSNQMQDKKKASKPDSRPSEDFDERYESFTAEQRALLASPALKKHIEEEKKKAVEAAAKKSESKPESPADTTAQAKQERLPFEEWVKGKKCNSCSKMGHLAKDCPDREKDEKKEGVSALAESVDDANAAEDDEEIDESHTWMCDPSASVDFAASEEVTATAFDGKSAVVSDSEGEGSAESEWCGCSDGTTLAVDSVDSRQCTSDESVPAFPVSSPFEASVGVFTFVWTEPGGTKSVRCSSSDCAAHPDDPTNPRLRVSLSIIASAPDCPASPFCEASVGVSTFIWDEPVVVGDAVDSDDEESVLIDPDLDSDDEDSDLEYANFGCDEHFVAESDPNHDDLASHRIPDFTRWKEEKEEIMRIVQLEKETKAQVRDLNTISEPKINTRGKAEKTQRKQETIETEEIELSRGQSKTDETVETVLMDQYHHHVMKGVLKTVPSVEEEIVRTQSRDEENELEYHRHLTDVSHGVQITNQHGVSVPTAVLRPKKCTEVCNCWKDTPLGVIKTFDPGGSCYETVKSPGNTARGWCPYKCSQQGQGGQHALLYAADQVQDAPDQRQGGGNVSETKVSTELDHEEKREPRDGVLLLVAKDCEALEAPRTPSSTTEVVKIEQECGRDQMGPLRRLFDPGGDCRQDPELRRSTARGWCPCESHQETKRGKSRTLFDPGGMRTGSVYGPCHTHPGFKVALTTNDPEELQVSCQQLSEYFGALCDRRIVLRCSDAECCA